MFLDDPPSNILLNGWVLGWSDENKDRDDIYLIEYLVSIPYTFKDILLILFLGILSPIIARQNKWPNFPIRA